MGKKKKKNKEEVTDNTTAPYYEWFVDGYNEGYAACAAEEKCNNEEIERGIRCDFCSDLEEGDYLYELEQEGDSLNFCGYKVWFCPVCGAKLGHGFLEEA